MSSDHLEYEEKQLKASKCIVLPVSSVSGPETTQAELQSRIEATDFEHDLANVIDKGWQQADAGDFVDSNPESVIRRV